jgi:hypothetical protein
MVVCQQAGDASAAMQSIASADVVIMDISLAV